MNTPFITVSYTSIRRNMLPIISFNVWKSFNKLSIMVNDALKDFNESSNTVNDIWKATNLTFTQVILTFMLYLKLLIWVNGSFKAFCAPFTAFDKILTDNFTKQII